MYRDTKTRTVVSAASGSKQTAVSSLLAAPKPPLFTGSGNVGEELQLSDCTVRQNNAIEHFI